MLSKPPLLIVSLYVGRGVLQNQYVLLVEHLVHTVKYNRLPITQSFRDSFDVYGYVLPALNRICLSSLQKASLVFYIGSRFQSSTCFIFSVSLSSAQVVVEYRLLYGNFLVTSEYMIFKQNVHPPILCFSPGYS